MTGSSKAYLLIGITVFFWSTVATAFKIALEELSIEHLLLFSSLASIIVLAGILIGQGKIRILLVQEKKGLINSALLGLINPFAYYLVLFKAYSLLPAQMAQPLNWTWPIVLSIMSAVFLGQKLSKYSLISIVSGFLGVVLISSKGDLAAFGKGDMTGVLLAVSSALIWASYWVINIRDKRDPLVKLTTNFLFGLIYIIAYITAVSDFIVPALPQILSSAYVGMFEMGFTFFTWLKALELAKDNAKMANFAYLAPFISLIFIYFILGEKILPTSIGGLLFIIAGILINNRKKA